MNEKQLEYFKSMKAQWEFYVLLENMRNDAGMLKYTASNIQAIQNMIMLNLDSDVFSLYKEIIEEE